MTRRHASPGPVGVAVGLALGLTVVACKSAGTRAPGIDMSELSLAEIEAELERNGEVLADAGIVVAALSEPPSPEIRGDGGEEIADEPDEPDEPDDVEELRYQDVEPTAKASPEPAPMADDRDDYAETEAESGDSRRRERSSTRRSRRNRKDTSTHCDRVCDLAEVTCDLEVQICDLALRHPDEPRYGQACQRAELQCLAADEACQACED